MLLFGLMFFIASPKNMALHSKIYKHYTYVKDSGDGVASCTGPPSSNLACVHKDCPKNERLVCKHNVWLEPLSQRSHSHCIFSSGQSLVAGPASQWWWAEPNLYLLKRWQGFLLYMSLWLHFLLFFLARGIIDLQWSRAANPYGNTVLPQRTNGTNISCGTLPTS
jgi:hypothetical protein